MYSSIVSINIFVLQDNYQFNKNDSVGGSQQGYSHVHKTPPPGVSGLSHLDKNTQIYGKSTPPKAQKM